MFEDLLIDQNPHWNGVAYQSGIERSCFGKLLKYMATGMIVSVVGVRRAGKSTLLKQVINYLMQQKRVSSKNILFLNLEHPYFSAYAKDVGNLQRVYEDYLKIANPKGKIYILLDEVQFFQEWPVFVKSHYEQKRVQLIVTGSNSALLSSDLMTLLSGRSLYLEVFPFSFSELAYVHNIDTNDVKELSKHRPKLRALIDQFLKYGGFPEVVAKLVPSVAFDILSAYAKTILYQDVAPRLQLRKSVELERLFVYLISNIGKPFSYANLSVLFDLTDKVIKDYIGAFADSYLLFELEMFDFSLKKQVRNPKKVYAIDTGEVNAIAFHFSENVGRLLENLVFLELRRLGLEVYYYKTQGGLEVDFLAKRNLKLALVQTAWDMRDVQTRAREQKTLAQACEELKLKQGLIITRDCSEGLVEDERNITVVPAYSFFCLSEDKKLELLGL
jgi:predicted AAA+ superfamily ATPase